MKFSYSFSGVFLSASLLASVATAQVPFTISNLSGGSTVVAGSNTSVEVVRTPDQPGIKTHDLAIVLTVSICSSEKGCQESNKLGTAEYIGPYDVNEHHGNGKGPGRQGLAAAKPAGGGGNGRTNTYVVTIPKADPAGKKVEKVMLNVIGVGLRGNSTKLSTFVESIHLPLTVVDEANGNGTSTGTATDGGPTGTGTATDGGPTGTGTATDGGPTGTGTATDGGPTGTGTATDGGPTGTGTATDGGPTGTGTATDGGPTGTGTATATDTGTNTGSSSSSSTTKAGATSKPTAVNGKIPAPTITVFPKGCKCSSTSSTSKGTRDEAGAKRAVDPAAPAYTTIRMSSRTRRRALS